MFTRVLLVLAAGVGLSACQPAIPESGFGDIPDPGRGVGFDDFGAQQQRRDAALAGTAATQQPVANNGSAAATAAETRRVLASTAPDEARAQAAAAASNSGVQPVIASPSNPAPAVVDGSGISRENNFDAVSSQRTIAADSQRIDANRAQYRLVEPEALPDRGKSGPNIVAYALANTHARGTQVYRRFGLNQSGKFQRSCAKYPRAAEAQIAFLESGGPERDRLGMDPDGDGYACDWDPTPFRQAQQAAPTQTPAQTQPPVISTERQGG